jgi:GAF domain-containing protein
MDITSTNISRSNSSEVILKQAESLTMDEPDWICNAANLSALLYWSLDRINWAGFYIFDGKELVLGPFQGKPACTRIALGKGVCGSAAQERRTLIVPNVNEFPGHIACDTASQSELVVPIITNNKLFGVVDIDSPYLARFDAETAWLCEDIAAIFAKALG